MTVRVLLFASWADAFGAPSVELDLADGATAADVLTALARRLPHATLPRPSIAINRSIAPRGALVRSGDELAIIPPVAGG
jgi:molybdopterin converting factor small subunit